MSYWKEISNNYVCESFDEKENCKLSVYIDAWKTDDENEEGKVIAQVILTKSNDIVVVYIDNIARTNDYAQKKIDEAINFLREEINKEK